MLLLLEHFYAIEGLDYLKLYQILFFVRFLKSVFFRPNLCITYNIQSNFSEHSQFTGIFWLFLNFFNFLFLCRTILTHLQSLFPFATSLQSSSSPHRLRIFVFLFLYFSLSILLLLSKGASFLLCCHLLRSPSLYLSQFPFFSPNKTSSLALQSFWATFCHHLRANRCKSRLCISGFLVRFIARRTICFGNRDFSLHYVFSCFFFCEFRKSSKTNISLIRPQNIKSVKRGKKICEKIFQLFFWWCIQASGI